MSKPTFQDKQKTLFERQKKLRENATTAECIFMERLNQLGINYIFQKCFIANDYYCFVDFYLPKPNKIVFEIDGGYHDEPKQMQKDNFRDYYLTVKRNFKVIRIKNENVGTFDLSIITKATPSDVANEI